MKKIVLVVIGTIALSIGAVDRLVGALVPHSQILMITGAIAIAAAGFMHRWKKLQKPKWPLLLAVVVVISGSAAVCAEAAHEWVLTPPVKTPVIQRNLISGPEVWVAIGIVVAVVLTWAAVYYFLRGRSEHPQR